MTNGISVSGSDFRKGLMAQELIYTSASRGLLPGSSGFCTVARTVGLSPVLLALLESRSGYRHLFPPQSDKTGLNPVNWVHGTIRLAQTPTHILSRIGDAGLDYTKRSNVIAHHLVLGPDELRTCGPAAILAQPGLMQTNWNQSPTEFAEERQISDKPMNSLQCVHWEQAAGDAGWGGVLAESVLQSRSACILYDPGTDLLPLFAESVALVPESLRWKVTFSTYVREVPAGGTFLWKGMIAGTPEAEQMRANKGILLIDLTATEQRTSPKDDSVFVKTARTGVAIPPSIENQPQTPPEPPPVFEEFDNGSIPPPVDGETYDINIDEASTKRKRNVGTWSSRYESQAVSTEKERKAKRIFFTILVFSFLAILILVTLLGDEFFNAGAMRKGVMQSFGGLAGSQNAEPDLPLPVIPPEMEPQENRKNEDETIIEIPPPLEPTEEELEELRRLEEEQAEGERRLEEERLAELERLQKEAEEEHERRKAEMREAFAAIPAAFPLAEPQVRPFGGALELPQNMQKEFALLSSYRDYVQIQWIPLLTPRGWRYHLEKVPPVFLDDPYAQWNLIAHLADGETESSQRTQRSLNLAALRLGEEGLLLEWRPQTAGLESNLELVNKLPFSYLRLTFGPNAATEGGPGREQRPLPIPKRFAPDDDITEIDFTRNIGFKDVALWTPIQNRPFVLSDRGTTITRPANPVERFDNVFGRDRFRANLNNLDLQTSLLLEVSVQPETLKSVTVMCEASEAPWKKTISFRVEPVTIPIAAEVFPDRIEFRDTSQEMQAEALRQRTALAKTVREKTETLDGTKIEEFRNEANPAAAFDLFKRSLQREIDDAQRQQTQANEQFRAIPEARKNVLTAGFSIHYSVYLQGREGTSNLLILTTVLP